MRSFNKIVGSFQKTLQQLEQLVELNDSRVESNSRLIDGLREQNLELISEKQAATNFKAGLQRLMGGDA